MATSDDLKDLPPEVIKQLMDSGVIDAKQARMALKLKEAKAVRGGASPRGTRGIGRGNIYVAANPLEHLVSGIRKYKAGKEIRGIEGRGKEGDENYEQGSAAALDEEDALARQKFWEIRQGGRDQGGASTTGYSEEMGPPTVEQDAAVAGQVGGGIQAPQPDIQNPMPDIPQDQMTIGAGGDTSRDIGGRVGTASVGDIPFDQPGWHPPMAPPGGNAPPGGGGPPVPPMGPPVAPVKTAQELYIEALRGLNVPQGGQGVY